MTTVVVLLALISLANPICGNWRHEDLIEGDVNLLSVGTLPLLQRPTRILNSPIAKAVPFAISMNTNCHESPCPAGTSVGVVRNDGKTSHVDVSIGNMAVPRGRIRAAVGLGGRLNVDEPDALLRKCADFGAAQRYPLFAITSRWREKLDRRTRVALYYSHFVCKANTIEIDTAESRSNPEHLSESPLRFGLHRFSCALDSAVASTNLTGEHDSCLPRRFVVALRIREEWADFPYQLVNGELLCNGAGGHQQDGEGKSFHVALQRGWHCPPELRSSQFLAAPHIELLESYPEDRSHWVEVVRA
jgi:hypothetical protein